jgi:hypothetical protein
MKKNSGFLFIYSPPVAKDVDNEIIFYIHSPTKKIVLLRHAVAEIFRGENLSELTLINRNIFYL